MKKYFISLNIMLVLIFILAAIGMVLFEIFDWKIYLTSIAATYIVILIIIPIAYLVQWIEDKL